MQKKLIALAVVGAIAAPAAMAEVTLSGGIQEEVRNVGGDGVSLAKGMYMTDGGEIGNADAGNYSFLKFAATEDLGGGLKALAQYNMNIAPNSTLGTRDAFVGLNGGFGTVLAGRLATPYKSSTVGWDPFLATSLQARGNGGMSDGNNGYADNALAYANAFGGVKVVAAIVFDEGAKPTPSDSTNGHNAWSASVNVPVGPAEIAVAYVNADKYSDITKLGLNGTSNLLGGVKMLDTLDAMKVGAKFNTGALTLAAQYEKLDVKTVGGAVDISPTVMWGSVSYALGGSNTLSASYGKTDWDMSGIDDTKYWAVGANHAFSKTTSAFVGYRNSDIGTNVDTASPTGTTDFGKEDTLSLGMRVAF